MTRIKIGENVRQVRGTLVLACVLALAACGGRHASDSSQVVASVGDDEITETQVNDTLARQGNLRPEQLDAAAHRAVSGLVEQQIVLQKAHDLKLDRDERVIQNIESMKRQLVATAYIERIADGAARPTARDAQDYFDHNPLLFAQRRVSTFQEIAVDVAPDQTKALQDALGALKTSDEMTALLQARKIPVRSALTTVTPENSPAPLVQRIASLAPGQGLIVPNPAGLCILVLQSTQDAPLSFEQASPAITAYLVAQNKRQTVERELAALRGNAHVAYFGKFSDLGASAPQASASATVATAAVASAPTR